MEEVGEEGEEDEEKGKKKGREAVFPAYVSATTMKTMMREGKKVLKGTFYASDDNCMEGFC